MPWQPCFGIFKNQRFVFLQGHQIIKRIFARQRRRLDQARQYITDHRSMLSFVKRRIFSDSNRYFERPLHNIIVDSLQMHLVRNPIMCILR